MGISSHRKALLAAARVALMQPGDVACFTGGLPHTTLVVGECLNLTGYESLVNWHPANIELLLRGFKRRPGDGVMSAKQVHILQEEMADEVVRCCKGGGFPAKAAAPLDGRSPKQLLLATSAVLARRRRCATRINRPHAPSELASALREVSCARSVSAACSDSPASSRSSSTSLPRPRQRSIRS